MILESNANPLLSLSLKARAIWTLHMVLWAPLGVTPEHRPRNTTQSYRMLEYNIART